MNDQRRPENNASSTPSGMWSSREAYLLAMVCLLVGAALGYFFRGSASSIPISATATQNAATPAMPPAGTPTGGMPPASGPPPTVAELSSIAAPMLGALKADPKNADVLIQLGNLYYDHRVYSESIPYYTRALEVRPRDVNVRTDLGTAYWYSGDAKNAIAQYDKSLAVDPHHTATMMNMGIVKLNGMNDPKGAVAIWEKLLKENPQFTDKQKVLDLIAQAKSAVK